MNYTKGPQMGQYKLDKITTVHTAFETRPGQPMMECKGSSYVLLGNKTNKVKRLFACHVMAVIPIDW